MQMAALMVPITGLNLVQPRRALHRTCRSPAGLPRVLGQAPVWAADGIPPPDPPRWVPDSCPSGAVPVAAKGFEKVAVELLLRLRRTRALAVGPCLALISLVLVTRKPLRISRH